MTSADSYRRWVRDKDLVSFSLVIKESDLHVRAASNLQRKAFKLLQKCRSPLEKYIERYPLFLTSLEPLPIAKKAPHIIKVMAEAASKAGTGPMAAVAGAIAEMVGTELLAFSPEVIVENGGDIFIKSNKNRLVGIFAADSPFTGKLGLEIAAEETPLGICTSSGTVGHSLSFGKADAVIVLSPSTALADATATAIGNIIVEAEDIPRGIEFAKNIDGIKGVVIIKGDKMGAWGDVKLKEMNT